jgi:tRNA U34 5-methylaminomethyl-2-thiouridine-forming methyltransferase MnmC
MPNVPIQIITTSDGSHSLLNTTLNETYHSVHGAIQESLHVFINNGLRFFYGRHKEEISVLEIGFGTGLNALLTLQFAEKNSCRINYTSLEAFPIDKETWQQLNYEINGNQEMFHELHKAEWNIENKISPHFKLLKLDTTIQDIELKNESFDVIYFDAFAPNKQPEMWELPILRKITLAMKPNGVFVTYCAKGQLKRDLRSLGLSVETLSGPPGKKEMVRAFKQQ